LAEGKRKRLRRQNCQGKGENVKRIGRKAGMDRKVDQRILSRCRTITDRTRGVLEKNSVEKKKNGTRKAEKGSTAEER